jgi:hypothetical protein
MTLPNILFHDGRDKSSSDLIPIPLTNLTGRLSFRGDSFLLGLSRLGSKWSFFLAFDINPFPTEYLFSLARKHGDMSFA